MEIHIKKCISEMKNFYYKMTRKISPDILIHKLIEGVHKLGFVKIHFIKAVAAFT